MLHFHWLEDGIQPEGQKWEFQAFKDFEFIIYEWRGMEGKGEATNP